MKKRAAVILASGKGTRMKSDLPKVAHKVGDKPMVKHVVDSAKGAGIEKVVVVVGYEANVVKDCLPGHKDFVLQSEQLGTGHAVLLTEAEFDDRENSVVVLCGDAPLVSEVTIKKLFDYHESTEADATVLTSILDNPYAYGRIIRDKFGHLEKIVEEKDASDAEREIKEINTGTYCFRVGPLFEALKSVGNDNAQGEYYLPDVLGIIRGKGGIIRVMSDSDATEVLGVNTLEQLAEVERIYQERIRSEK